MKIMICSHIRSHNGNFYFNKQTKYVWALEEFIDIFISLKIRFSMQIIIKNNLLINYLVQTLNWFETA